MCLGISSKTNLRASSIRSKKPSPLLNSSSDKLPASSTALCFRPAIGSFESNQLAPLGQMVEKKK